MSSHSETTKPLTESELAEMETLVHVLDTEDSLRLIATIRSRDERIGALSALLEEAAMTGSWKLDALHDWQDRVRALLTEEADDG